MDDDFADQNKSDESFLDFLARRFPGKDHAEAKQWATGYVSGFNAADPALVSTRWLVDSRHADEQIEGERAFHVAGGYQRILNIFTEELKALNVVVHLNTIVRRIGWSARSVELVTRNQLRESRFSGSRALITLPLGVLQSPNFVRFQPEPPTRKKAALEKLAMGKVVRVNLCFRERFWKDLRATHDSHSLGDLSFLFSRDTFFPTWWTQMPETVPS